MRTPSVFVRGLLVSCSLALASGCGGLPDGATEETLDSQVFELRKGSPGAVNGDSNYCDDPAHRCAAGEGDCDSNDGCEQGLICAGHSEYFGLRAGNACVPPHCANRTRDADETQIDCGGSCGASCPPVTCPPNGAANRCSSDCLCGPGEGDCDSNDTCQTGLVCGRGKLSQFGLTGDACVPAHCVNKIQDADESQVDCGGSCGSAICPNVGCLQEGSVWAIAIKGGFRTQERGLYHGTCRIESASYQRTMQATLRNGALEIEDQGFQGTYPIVQNREDGFTAEKSDLFGDNYACGFAELYGYGSHKFGRVTINVRCSSRTAIFNATCYSDLSADGCFPNYEEKAVGSGPQLLCTRGHVAVGGACVDVDECAVSPCDLGETCTNLDGSYSCSCEAPSKRCDGLCANVTNDPQNCGDCGVACRSDQICGAAVCMCPAGYADVGACVDIDECATGTHDCSPLADCANTVGGFICTCRSGYGGDGKSCADINECASAPCAQGEECTNTEGSYTCTCPATRTVCGAGCVDTKTDELNCGTCDNQCAAGSACIEGSCVPWVWSSIDPGQRHTCGIGPEETLLCWGANDEGQAGPPAGRFTTVSSGVIHSCAVRSDSTVACFGSNSAGQSTPPNGTFLAVGTGFWHSCGLRTDGTISCWGSNSVGQLLSPSGTFVSLSTGEHYNCALRMDGSLMCWGYQGSYYPYPVSSTFTAVSASSGISCAIRGDKTLACWGPVAGTPPAGTFSAVSVGAYFACGLRTDGTIACWGDNYFGQTNAPAGEFAWINSGYSHACALRTDGLPVCWGFNQYGQCNPPTF